MQRSIFAIGILLGLVPSTAVLGDTLIHTTASLSASHVEFAATSAGGDAFFAGGTFTNNVVDIYSQTTQSWSVSHLSVGRLRPRGRVLGKSGILRRRVWRGI